MFDNHGHAFNPGYKVSSFAFFEKFCHVKRLNDTWQLTNVLVGVLTANMHMYGSIGGSRINKSLTGNGDWINCNFIGRWWKNHTIHTAAGFGIKFPLGDYDKHRMLNIGENRFILYNFVAFEIRYPLRKGIFFLDGAVNVAWNYKNLDTNYNDHDTTECDLLLTYFTSKDCKFGIFVQPDYQGAINESTVGGLHMRDADFYTFGTAFGFIWNMKPGHNVNLKWIREWVGEGLNYGAPAPKIDALHFMWTYSF